MDDTRKSITQNIIRFYFEKNFNKYSLYFYRLSPGRNYIDISISDKTINVFSTTYLCEKGFSTYLCVN